MENRRNFIKTGLLLSGALSLNGIKALNFEKEIPDSPSDTESYWSLVRSQFPLGYSKIFLNNGTVGPSPYPVLREVQDDMLEVDTSARYGGYEDVAIKALARFMNSSESEITLTRNVTEGINIVCWGLPLKKGDEVIMTGHEHVGHATPWLNRSRLHGIRIKIFKLGMTAEETLSNLKSVITKKTRVISVPHIPCTIGQILPVKEICKLAKERNIFCFLDGAHPPGMLNIDLKDIGCDLYASCCHKWMLGPKGTGFLFVSENIRNNIQAYYGGGGFDSGWDMLSIPPALKGYAENGHRYYYGTQNPSLFKGIAKAVEFQENIGRALIEKRVRALSSYLQEQLISLSKDVEMLTPVESISRGAQVSFKMKDREMSKLQTLCSENHIVTRYVPENNINCLRISTHIYNNYDELNKFIKVCDQFIRG